MNRIYLSKPHIGRLEKKFVNEAFKTNWVSTVGSNINDLENSFYKYTNCHCLAVSTGTAAIHLALKVLDIKHGDEVIVSDLTFVAALNPILYENALPVLIDSEDETWNMDPELLENFLIERAKINKIPKFLIVVHLFGQSAKIDQIVNIAKKYNIYVIEDAAEAVGALYKKKKPGTFGDLGIYSLNGNKIITASSGGIFITKNIKYYKKAKKLSSQSKDHDPIGINNYMHSSSGYNYRMSNILAGIGLGQINQLESRVNLRRDIFYKYKKAFKNIEGIMPQPEYKFCFHTRWLSCFLIRFKNKNAKQLIKHLEKHNIESRPVWRPMHMQKLNRSYEFIGSGVSKYLNENGICLPSSSNMTNKEQEFVIESVIKYFNEN